MTINYAILGLLSWKPCTGYELKKIFEESVFMYWSGNNNQIYKSLVQLLDDGMVTNEVQHQESSPSKKIYTITEAGRWYLRNWIVSSPEAPEFKKTFLIQLAWSDQLDDRELDDILSKYENEVKIQIMMVREKWKRRQYSPGRSKREAFLWDMIYENLISSCQNELDWIEKVRGGLKQNERLSFKKE
ncbi:MAG TPA: helix-turn-helix transcriptional regulator [Clostridia bacterium]|nr:helix-turn-helix transcriptional regulator [Clostridia bacterium]